jgi:outer membrane protein OmpA-like peptidoglycan-associated protein
MKEDLVRNFKRTRTKADPVKADEQRAALWKRKIDAFSDALNLGYKVAAGLGAITTFGYLMLIGFFPSGLTPGEVIFFVFIALAFAVIYSLIMVYGAVACIWLAHLISMFVKLPRYSVPRFFEELFPTVLVESSVPGVPRVGLSDAMQAWWRRRRLAASRIALEKRGLVPTYARGGFLCFVSLFVFSTFAFTAFVWGSAQAKETFIAFLGCGFFVLVFSVSLPRIATTTKAKVSMMVGIAFIPLVIFCMCSGPSFLLNLVFGGLGIRMQGVSIEIPDSEIGGIERIAELVHRPLVDCRRPQANRRLVHGANILWTGIGDQTLVQFTAGNLPERALFAPRHDPVPMAEIKFETKAIRIIKTNPHIDPCFDLSSDLLFDTGKYELSPAAVERINEVSASITQFGKPSKIFVRGHSDPRPILVGSDGIRIDNQLLSERRANAIAKLLREILNKEKVTVVSEGAGSRELRVQCPADRKSSIYEQDQCNKPNRRVEIRVNYEH